MPWKLDPVKEIGQRLGAFLEAKALITADSNEHDRVVTLGGVGNVPDRTTLTFTFTGKIDKLHQKEYEDELEATERVNIYLVKPGAGFLLKSYDHENSGRSVELGAPDAYTHDNGPIGPKPAGVCAEYGSKKKA
jgi:hypothetical protein